MNLISIVLCLSGRFLIAVICILSSLVTFGQPLEYIGKLDSTIYATTLCDDNQCVFAAYSVGEEWIILDTNLHEQFRTPQMEMRVLEIWLLPTDARMDPSGPNFVVNAKDDSYIFGPTGSILFQESSEYRIERLGANVIISTETIGVNGYNYYLLPSLELKSVKDEYTVIHKANNSLVVLDEDSIWVYDDQLELLRSHEISDVWDLTGVVRGSPMASDVFNDGIFDFDESTEIYDSIGTQTGTRLCIYNEYASLVFDTIVPHDNGTLNDRGGAMLIKGGDEALMYDLSNLRCVQQNAPKLRAFYSSTLLNELTIRTFTNFGNQDSFALWNTGPLSYEGSVPQRILLPTDTFFNSSSRILTPYSSISGTGRHVYIGRNHDSIYQTAVYDDSFSLVDTFDVYGSPSYYFGNDHLYIIGSLQPEPISQYYSQYFYKREEPIISSVYDREIPSSTLRIYPNPSSGDISFEGLPGKQVVLFVSSLDGKQVAIKRVFSPFKDLSLELPEGQYVITIFDSLGHLRSFLHVVQY